MSIVGNLTIMSNDEDFPHPLFGGSIEVDQEAPGAGSPGVVEANDTPQTINFSPLTPGLVYMENMDDELDVRISVTGDLLLKPGDKILLRLDTGASLDVETDAATHDAKVIVVGYNA